MKQTNKQHVYSTIWHSNKTTILLLARVSVKEILFMTDASNYQRWSCACLSVCGIILFIHENSVSLLFQLNPKVGLNIKFTLKQTGLLKNINLNAQKETLIKRKTLTDI